MSSPADDFDPRVLLLATHAFHKRSSEDVDNGLLVQSKVGLHFYQYDKRRRDGTIDTTEIKHFVFDDLVRVNPSRSVGGADLYLRQLLALGYKPNRTPAYRVGHLADWGRGVGQLIAGATNLARRASSKDTRAAFLEAVQEAKNQAPQFSEPPAVNPHLLRMAYFESASALGPALFYADLALKCAELQEIIARGPGCFERGRLRSAGHNKNKPLPIIQPQELTNLKRHRAWLLIDGERYETLISESLGKRPDDDPEVVLAYGVAHALGGKPSSAVGFFSHAKEAEPGNLKILVGAAWGLALQGRKNDAVRLIVETQERAQHDRHALLLLGEAAEALGNPNKALDYYVQSASLARGYFQGTTACQRTLALAQQMDTSMQMKAAQYLAKRLPDQREAWQGLAKAAERAGDTSLALQARERVTTMEGEALIL